MSQEGGPAESGGLRDDLRPTGVDAGTGSPLPGPAHLAEPGRGAFPEQPGLPETHPGKNIDTLQSLKLSTLFNNSTQLLIEEVNLVHLIKD